MWMKTRFQGLGGEDFLVMGWWRCAARWGLHFHAWINLKGVTFLIKFTHFWNFWVKKILFGRDFKMGSTRGSERPAAPTQQTLDRVPFWLQSILEEKRKLGTRERRSDSSLFSLTASSLFTYTVYIIWFPGVSHKRKAILAWLNYGASNCESNSYQKSLKSSKSSSSKLQSYPLSFTKTCAKQLYIIYNKKTVLVVN